MRGSRRYPPVVRICQVPHCDAEATAGEDWREPFLGPVEAYRLGIQLRLSVVDLAVVLRLCEPHAKELAAVGWGPVEERLSSWGWQPLPRPGGA